jgi:putative colanic acid biosynthesis acetyltransferase WcaF
MIDLSAYSSPLSYRNRLGRVAWACAWLFCYRPTPAPLHAWRRFLLRCFGAKIGRGAHPYPGAKIWAPWNLEMGDHSCIADGVNCYCVARIRLGRNALVSQRTFLCTGTHDYADPSFRLRTAPIEIGDGAWVAAEAFIGPGVSVGAGAVVYARACVFKDVEPAVVVGGNPAHVINRRDADRSSDPRE